MTNEKVLIIKTGYSELLVGEESHKIVSYGDVFRATPILNLYKEDNVTWVSDERAFPLLEGNPYIKNLLSFDLINVLRLESEKFDTIINLEKIPGICALADKINAEKKYGFKFNARSGKVDAYDNALDILAITANPSLKKKNVKTFQELLFNTLGAKWDGEEYVLGYKPKTEEIYDVCLNTIIGPKYPNKSWPIENWNALENLIKEGGLSVTRQDKYDTKILTNFYDYIDWINSSKVMVSIDSLGLHLAIALKKTALGLFGPTQHREVCFYGRGKAILPEKNYDCIPCEGIICNEEKSCMKDISPKRLCSEVKNYIIKKND